MLVTGAQGALCTGMDGECQVAIRDGARRRLVGSAASAVTLDVQRTYDFARSANANVSIARLIGKHQGGAHTLIRGVWLMNTSPLLTVLCAMCRRWLGRAWYFSDRD